MPKPASELSVLRGIGFSVAGYFLFSLQDATIKWLAAGFSAPQILFMRSLVVAPFCLCFFGPGLAPRALVSPMRVKLLVRSVVIVVAWAFYYTAARYLQLAELVTIYFSSPLLVAALAPLILREHVRCFGMGGQFMSTEAVRLAPATVVAPISFSSLIWAFLLGFVIWGDVPDRAVFVGAGLILLSGLVVTSAEFRTLRRRRRELLASP